MDDAYRVDAWQPLYATVASATAALTGLLFVALSLNLRTIIRVPAHRARASEALGGMLSLLVLSIIMLIPGQERHFIAFELFAGGLFLLIIGVRLQSQTIGHLLVAKRTRWALRVVVLNLGALFGMFAGISLFLGRFGGLYWLVPTVILYIVWSINNAWLLVVQATGEVP
jgi:hypothetical protein